MNNVGLITNSVHAFVANTGYKIHKEMHEAENRYDFSSQIRSSKDNVDNYLIGLHICSHDKVNLIRPLNYAQSFNNSGVHSVRMSWFHIQ